MNPAENLEAVRQRIKAACDRSDREPNSITLLAVTKSQPPEIVAAAAELGLIFFGENKIQEARAKIPLCPGKLRWHFIGHLQSNKCRDAVELFEMIQSVDSLPLAQEINRRCEQAAKRMPILLEVNVAGETSKFGYQPEKLLAELKEIHALMRLEIRGLMTVPPWSAEPEKARPFFQQLRELKTRCEQVVGMPLPHLSMGMSGDFETAVALGTTYVRVGTAIFGERSIAP